MSLSHLFEPPVVEIPLNARLVINLPDEPGRTHVVRKRMPDAIMVQLNAMRYCKSEQVRRDYWTQYLPATSGQVAEKMGATRKHADNKLREAMVYGSVVILGKVLSNNKIQTMWGLAETDYPEIADKIIKVFKKDGPKKYMVPGVWFEALPCTCLDVAAKYGWSKLKANSMVGYHRTVGNVEVARDIPKQRDGGRRLTIVTYKITEQGKKLMEKKP